METANATNRKTLFVPFLRYAGAKEMVSKKPDSM